MKIIVNNKISHKTHILLLLRTILNIKNYPIITHLKQVNINNRVNIIRFSLKKLNLNKCKNH